MLSITFVTAHGTYDWWADTEPDIESVQEYFRYIYPWYPVHGIMAFCGEV